MPAGQEIHVLIEPALSVALYVPAGQLVHVFAACKEYVPPGQSSHFDALAYEYVPLKHR